MNIVKRMFSSNKLTKIFTPNTVAKLTYVSRSNIENELEKALSLPGKQIVMYGHSGSGKTTLLQNTLKHIKQNYVKTHCQSSTSFNDLLLEAFDSLNMFYVSEKTTNAEYTVSLESKAEFSGISSQINASTKDSYGEKSIKICPPQLTPQKLAKFLGEVDCVWIIEDFHKVLPDEKKRIADAIKIFVDTANDYSKIKVICVGAVGTARELVSLDNNLNNRVTELYVPLLSETEIESIITVGFDLLNVKMDDKLKEKIVYYSNNLASITHQICYDLCYTSNIKESSLFSQSLQSDSFLYAINSYVKTNFDTFTKIFDLVVCQHYGWNVLKAYEQLEKEALTFKEIKNKIPNYKRPLDEDLTSFLEQLGSTEYNEIIRFDSNSKKYLISSPFFHAFLKMKFALEQKEQKDIRKKRSKKINHRFSINRPNEVHHLIIDDDYLFQILKNMMVEK